MAVTQETLDEIALSRAEYDLILERLDREPNSVELGMFGALWSEHCGYKHSRPLLSLFRQQSSRVLSQTGAENAGAVDIGDGLAVVFKVESHNHPSAVEPLQGAATGVGGIVRDILAMGARPIALLNSLRFGPLDDPQNRHLFHGVVGGISWYGNCIGVPDVAGEICFDESYSQNPLVNAMCVGLVRTDSIATSAASEVGNVLLLVGAGTGRDGIHGASGLASRTFEEKVELRPTVQVGDPFTEKLLLESCLEIMKHDWVVGVQDMGAAGLTSSSFEMASRAGMGIEMDLSQVPLREEGMTPYETLLSESQERMLFVIEEGHEQDALDIFRKWDLDAAVIGQVVQGGNMRIICQGQEVVNLPVHAVVEGGLECHRPARRPEYLDEVQSFNLNELPEPERGDEILKKLLGSLTIASKESVYEQYDHMVRLNTLVLPGSDAAVIRIKDTHKALAIAVDCNSRYCYLDPYLGAQIAVAECSRNIVCSGAEPIGVTNCLNFGNPEKPEIMWQFEQAVKGLGDLCRFLEIPVVSGNVSLYNETHGAAIFPTPTVAVVGLLEDQTRHCTQWFKNSGDLIGLLGVTQDELGGTEYLKTRFDLTKGKPPALDRELEKKVQRLCLKLIEKNLVASAHDCSEGGLAVAVVESCITGPGNSLGAEINLESGIRADALMVGES
ncbi:MAG: phosphoribosylformylglycinamidine synthase subunit PurL, partial [Chloroflexi bacterium]|nr:phosphoribosylformylglycinamidine synthase subunit PurL [Chloroflexota bacterium]